MQIYLRPVGIDDGSLIVKWRNSTNVLRHCFNKNKITIESNKKFFRDCIETGKYKQFIVERIDDDFGLASYPISTVYLKDFDDVNKRCELCIFTSDDNEWNVESQRLAIKYLLNKAFNDYGIHKIYTFVFSDNKNEIELMLSTGFRKEAVLIREAINLNGEYVDVFRMTITSNIYKKLKDID